MAAPERIHLLCPQCVEGIDVMVYRSIDNQLPDAVNQTISGALFKYRCPHCGRKTTAGMHYCGWCGEALNPGLPVGNASA